MISSPAEPFASSRLHHRRNQLVKTGGSPRGSRCRCERHVLCSLIGEALPRTYGRLQVHDSLAMGGIARKTRLGQETPPTGRPVRDKTPLRKSLR